MLKDDLQPTPPIFFLWPRLPEDGICIIQILTHPVDPGLSHLDPLMPGHSSVPRCHIQSGFIERPVGSFGFSRQASQWHADRPPLISLNGQLSLPGCMTYISQKAQQAGCVSIAENDTNEEEGPKKVKKKTNNSAGWEEGWNKGNLRKRVKVRFKPFKCCLVHQLLFFQMFFIDINKAQLSYFRELHLHYSVHQITCYNCLTCHLHYYEYSLWEQGSHCSGPTHPWVRLLALQSTVWTLLIVELSIWLRRGVSDCCSYK